MTEPYTATVPVPPGYGRPAGPDIGAPGPVAEENDELVPILTSGRDKAPAISTVEPVATDPDEDEGGPTA